MAEVKIEIAAFASENGTEGKKCHQKGSQITVVRRRNQSGIKAGGGLREKKRKER